MKYIIFTLLIFFKNMSFADCLQAAQGQPICPLTLNHLKAIHQMHKCEEQQIGSQSCMDNVKGGVTSDAAFTLLGFANAGKMSPQERHSLVKEFFKNNKEELRDAAARAEFDFRIKQPQLISHAEVNGLISEYRNHLTRIKSYPDNADLKSDFIEFKTKNKDQLSIISRLYDSQKSPNDPSFYDSFKKSGPKKIKFQVYKPMIVGGIDVANAKYEDVKKMADVVEDREGKKYNTKTLFKNQSERVVDELEKNLLSGMDLNEALKKGQFSSWKYDQMQTRRLGLAIKDVAIAAQIERGVEIPEKTVRASKYLKALKQGRVKTPSRLKHIGMFSGGVAAIGAISIAQIMIENQQLCNTAFPYTPTSYRQPAVSGLGDESRCPMNMPKKGEELPQKVRAWLYGNEMDALVILNSFEGGNSPCTYATRVYNNYFCDENTDARSGQAGAIK